MINKDDWSTPNPVSLGPVEKHELMTSEEKAEEIMKMFFTQFGYISSENKKQVALIAAAIHEADAEGYLRGRVDEAKECDAHAQREYRRGVGEAAKIAKENSDINKGFNAECDCYERILHRGTGGGE